MLLLGSSVKNVLLDSVIVGELNHDLRTKRNLELLEWVNVYYKGLIKKIKMSTMYGTNRP